MSLMPSNMIAATDNPGRTMFPNLARRKGDASCHEEVDVQVKRELETAGITIFNAGDWMRTKGEVPAAIMGELCSWSFTRAWYYWVAEGPGIPPDLAEEFHKTWGNQVRVGGHCGCPSPLEWCHGFAVGSYHIDTQEGLAAFAELLKRIYRK